MTIDNLQSLSLILYLLALIFFIIAIVFFFAYKIPQIISDLSGRTERLAIENIRNKTENPTEKTFRAAITNQTVKPTKKSTNDLGMRVGTAKISTARLQEETVLLTENEETTLLSEGMDTTVLSEDGVYYGDTTVLSEEFVEFEILKEIGYCGSAEIIE